MAQEENIELAKPVVNHPMWKYWKAALRDEMMSAAVATQNITGDEALVIVGQIKAFATMHNMIKTVDSDGLEE